MRLFLKCERVEAVTLRETLPADESNISRDWNPAKLVTMNKCGAGDCGQFRAASDGNIHHAGVGKRALSQRRNSSGDGQSHGTAEPAVFARSKDVPPMVCVWRSISVNFSPSTQTSITHDLIVPPTIV
jgi:hypothetical protein